MNHAFELVTSYGYIIVFLAVFLDQAIISAPSPPFITAIGVLSASGRFNLWIALLVVFGAGCLADSLWYVMGKSRHNRLTSRLIPKQLRNKAASVAKFVDRGMLSGLLTVKFSLFPSPLVPFFAGSSRFSPGRFLLFQAIANLVWGSIFLFGGFLTANRSLHVLLNLKDLLSRP
jgi:membrane-associated protein